MIADTTLFLHHKTIHLFAKQAIIYTVLWTRGLPLQKKIIHDQTHTSPSYRFGVFDTLF